MQIHSQAVHDSHLLQTNQHHRRTEGCMHMHGYICFYISHKNILTVRWSLLLQSIWKASDFSAPTTLALCLKTHPNTSNHQNFLTLQVLFPKFSFPKDFSNATTAQKANPGALGSMTFSSIGIHGRFPSKWPLTPKEAHLSNSWLLDFFFLTKSGRCCTYLFRKGFGRLTACLICCWHWNLLEN